MSVVGPRPRVLGIAENDEPPLQLLKAGMLSVAHTNWKLGDNTISRIKTEEEYLDFYTNSSVFHLVWANFIIIIDGLRAVLMGKGL